MKEAVRDRTHPTSHRVWWRKLSISHTICDEPRLLTTRRAGSNRDVRSGHALAIRAHCTFSRDVLPGREGWSCGRCGALMITAKCGGAGEINGGNGRVFIAAGRISIGFYRDDVATSRENL